MLDVQQTAFDWGSLDRDTHAFVLEKTEAIKARMKRTAEDVIAIGQDLRAGREKLSTGGRGGMFLAWIASEFEMSQRTAYRFMQSAEEFGGDKFAIVANFPPTVLYMLLDSPKEIREQVTSGQIPASLPAIREAKAALRSPEPEPEAEQPWYEEDTPEPAPSWTQEAPKPEAKPATLILSFPEPVQEESPAQTLERIMDEAGPQIEREHGLAFFKDIRRLREITRELDQEILDNAMRICDPRMFPVYEDTLQIAQSWIDTVREALQAAKHRPLSLVEKARMLHD